LTIRSPEDTNVHLTTALGITCYRRERVTLYVERDLATGEKGHEPIIRLLSDGKEALISTNRINVNSLTDYRAEIMPFDEVMKLVPKRGFELKLDYPTPEWASKSATIKLSIAGFESALKTMQRECDRIHAPKPEAAPTTPRNPEATPTVEKRKPEAPPSIPQKWANPDAGRTRDCNFDCETPWIERTEGSQAYTLLKVLSRRWIPTGQQLSTTLGLSCSTPREINMFVGRTPTPDEGPSGPAVSIRSDKKLVWLAEEKSIADQTLDYRSQVIPLDDILKAAPKQSLEYTETFQGHLAWRSRTTKLSIEGMEAALLNMQERCSRIQPAAPQSAQTEQ
jgi:hypothetical protein